MLPTTQRAGVPAVYQSGGDQSVLASSRREGIRRRRSSTVDGANSVVRTGRILPDSVTMLDLSLSACESRHEGSGRLIEAQIQTARNTMAAMQSLGPVIKTLNDELDDLLKIHTEAERKINPANLGWCEWFKNNTISATSKLAETAVTVVNAGQALIAGTTDWISPVFSVKVGGTLVLVQYGAGWVKANVLKEIEQRKARWIALNKLCIATIKRLDAEVKMFELYEFAVTGSSPIGASRLIGEKDDSGSDYETDADRVDTDSEMEGLSTPGLQRGQRERSRSRIRPPSRKGGMSRRGRLRDRSAFGDSRPLRPRSLSPKRDKIRRPNYLTDIESGSDSDSDTGFSIGSSRITEGSQRRTGRSRDLSRVRVVRRSTSPHAQVVTRAAMPVLTRDHVAIHMDGTRSPTTSDRSSSPPTMRAHVVAPIHGSTAASHLLPGAGTSSSHSHSVLRSDMPSSGMRRRFRQTSGDGETKDERSYHHRRRRRTSREDKSVKQFERAVKAYQESCGGQNTTLPLANVMEIFVARRSQETGKSPLEMRFKPSTPVGKQLVAAAVNVHYRTTSGNGSSQLSGSPPFPLQGSMQRLMSHPSFVVPVSMATGHRRSPRSRTRGSHGSLRAGGLDVASLSKKDRKFMALRPDPEKHPVWAAKVAKLQLKMMRDARSGGSHSHHSSHSGSSGTHGRGRRDRRHRHSSSSSDGSGSTHRRLAHVVTHLTSPKPVISTRRSSEGSRVGVHGSDSDEAVAAVVTHDTGGGVVSPGSTAQPAVPSAAPALASGLSTAAAVATTTVAAAASTNAVAQPTVQDGHIGGKEGEGDDEGEG